MKQSLGRRSFLRGLGGMMLAVPALESLACKSEGVKPDLGKVSQGLAVNKRFVSLFTSFGQPDGLFFPTGTESAFNLSPILAPLAAHQKDMLVLKEIDLLPFVKAGLASGGVGHGAPFCYVVGGWPIFQGDSTPGPGGISLDQKIAQTVGGATRLRSLPIDIGNSEQYLTRTISYTGANQPLPAFRDPVAAFNKVFAGFNVDPNVLKNLQAERRSVLDFVLEDYSSLRSKVGSGDQKTLDFHMQSVRELETQIANLSTANSCQVPTLNNPPRDLGTWQQGAGPDTIAITDFHLDLIATALACDITRVATVSFPAEIDWDSNLRGLDASLHLGSQHLASHEHIANFAKMQTWYAARIAKFVQKLKDKAVFDNSLFMWFSENGATGSTHSAYDMPYVLFGNAGGSLRTGRYLKCGHRTPNDLYIAIQNAYGVSDTVFGDPAACTGPLNLT
jgi:hypothetical protein